MWDYEPMPEPPGDEWVPALVRGWMLIEKHGPDGALTVAGGREAVEAGFDPLFMERYEALDGWLDRLDAERRERDGEAEAEARLKGAKK